MESVSNKSLWGLISGEGIQTEKGIIETELLAQEDLLKRGLLDYKPPSAASLEKFKKNKDIGESWRDFVVKLSAVLGVEENGCWNILCSYLASEFRGTSDSLADLLKNDSQAKPLLLDIWQFYRAERLYLLQVLKEVLSFHSNGQSSHRSVFEKVLDKIDEGGDLKQSLMDQFDAVVAEEMPKTEGLLGKALSQTLKQSWTHFHLREQTELLQLLLLYLYQSEEKTEADFLSLSTRFSAHEFGSKQAGEGEDSGSCPELVSGIGQLEAAILVLLLDLSSIQSPGKHKIFTDSGPAPAVERLISGLGNLPAHGPPMLAFMLGCYLSRGQEGLASVARFGEEAIAGNVLQTLLATLRGDFCNSGLVSDVLHTLMYSTLSALVSAFDPTSLGLTVDTHNLIVQLLGHRHVAHHFWKSPTGLALYFEELKLNFPLDHSNLLDVCVSLASASKSSCTSMVSALASLPCLTDSLELLPQTARHLPEGRVELTEPLFPYPGTESVCLSPGTQGIVSPSGTSVRWMPSAPQNGWQMILADTGHLAAQARAGAGNVHLACLKRVTTSARLVAAVLATDPSLAPQLSQITSSLLSVLAVFGQLPSPPLSLVASITEIFASLSTEDPSSVLARLSCTSLLPRTVGGQFHPGVVGQLLATQETVAGEFPCLLAFLRLATLTAGESAAAPCILFILSEVLPQFSRWRYEVSGDREKVAVLALTAVLKHLEEPEGLQLMAGDRGLASCLLSLSSTGDRVIQTLLEAQTNWEAGRGADLASVVHLSLTILHKLVTSKETETAVMTGPVGVAIRAPPQGSAPHYLLTLAHYTYFFHRPELAISAVQLLTAISRDTSVHGAPVSVLACLSGAATAVRDMLLARLESNTEDIRLKIAIVDLLAACVDQQPGMVQLLMDINTDVKVVATDAKGVVGKKAGTTSPELVGEGCLAPVMKLLGLCNTETLDGPAGPWLELHLSIVKLVDCLWSRGRILAAQHLKEQPGFWSSLCHPITTASSTSNGDEIDEVRAMKIKAFVLRIVSHEIYTWTGKISDGLNGVIENICDEKSTALINWCDVEDNDCNDNTTIIDSDPDENIPLFLLSSWRAFFLVLSKDSPSSLSPAACRAVFLSTTSKLTSCLAQSPPPPRLTVILAETAAVLARRWQTKTTDCMDSWCSTMSGLLDRLAGGWGSLHPRARLAILALGLTTLKVSQFKLEPKEEGVVLSSWLDPTLSLLATNFRELETRLQAGEPPSPDLLRSPELCLALLHGLINRLPSSVWLPALHREASLALLLSAGGACCRAKAASSLVLSILPLLLEVGSSASGANCLLLQDLARDLWLPLSDLPSPHPEWLPVRQTGLELAGVLVRVGKRPAVDTAVTAAALMSEKIAADLLSPRQDLSHLARAAAATRFVGSLASYCSTWQADHPASLLVVYRACCRLLHTATALLIRPSLLSALVKGAGGAGGGTTQEEARRVRRMSSTSCSELEVDSVGPEAVPAHGLLLEICHGCVTLLQALSPPLPSLLAGSALLDPDRWESLLTATFSSPTLEQDGDIPTYGTLLALANVCVRSLARDARSPSPGRSVASPVRGRPTSAPPPDTPERRRLVLVLERCLSLLLQQALLSLGQGQSANSRETQLLRRELGAELGSITDTWRRHLHRGGRSPGPVRGAKSPGPAKSPAPPLGARAKSPGSSAISTPQPPPSPQPQGRTSRAEMDSFMKFISSLVHNVFK